MDINKKVVVLGAKGMLGYAVSKYYLNKRYKVISISRDIFDASKDSVEKLAGFLEGAWLVINCIGIIRQVMENVSDEEVLKVNGVFPKNLALLCKRLKVKLIHVTTDCVYSGRKGDYNETDYFDPVDLYGISKIAGEHAECMTLRTSIIGPEAGSNRSLLQWAFNNKGIEVKGFTNHFWNGLTTLYFAEITEKILINGLYKEGIVHIHSPNSVSKFDLLNIFNDTFGLKMQIKPFETAEKCDRTMSSNYDISEKFVTRTIQEQVNNVKIFFNL